MDLCKVIIRNAEGAVLRLFIMSRIGSIELALDYERRNVSVTIEVTPIKQ